MAGPINAAASEAARTTRVASGPSPDHLRRRVVAALARALLRHPPGDERELDALLEALGEPLREAAGAEVLAIYMVDGPGLRLQGLTCDRLAARDPDTAAALRSLAGHRLPPARGFAGRAVRDGEPARALEAAHAADHEPFAERKAFYAIHALAAAPITDGGEAYGALEVWNKASGRGAAFFSEADVSIVEQIGRAAGALFRLIRHPEPGRTPRDAVAPLIAQLSGAPFLELGECRLDRALAAEVGVSHLRALGLVPLDGQDPDTVDVATDDPLDLARRDALRIASGRRVQGVFVVRPTDLEAALCALHDDAPWPAAAAETATPRSTVCPEARADLHAVGDRLIAALTASRRQGAPGDALEIPAARGANAAPVVELWDRLIEQAAREGASDLHVEPLEEAVRVRFRIDGVLHERLRLPDRSAIRPLVARLKVMAALNPSETRLPQDGRIAYRSGTQPSAGGDEDLDLRVSTFPMAWGEKVVLRLLRRRRTALGLDTLGFSPKTLAEYRRLLEAPHGMILHTGPTGSGKTTSLYAALTEIASPERNVVTAEDPIEVLIPGVNQCQVRPQIGLDFAAALRHFLRQDPDVILVGEVRDAETARIAVEAALTGHLLLSTLHTNDAASSVVRLVELGVEPFLVASSLLGVLSQRLCRVLCDCKRPHVPSATERAELELGAGENAAIFRPRSGGCRRCHGTGYRGRVGVHELLRIDDELRALITRPETSAAQLARAARARGMRPLADDARAKVLAGLTSLEEARRLGLRAAEEGARGGARSVAGGEVAASVESHKERRRQERVPTELRSRIWFQHQGGARCKAARVQNLSAGGALLELGQGGPPAEALERLCRERTPLLLELPLTPASEAGRVRGRVVRLHEQDGAQVLGLAFDEVAPELQAALGRYLESHQRAASTPS